MERPIRLAIFDPENMEMGLQIISLVETPAIGFEAIKMSEHIKLEIQDEEERIIFTPILIPDQKIYRNDPKLGEFDLMFPKEVIKQVLIQFSKKNINSNVDIHHSEKLIEGATFFEFFLKDSRRAKSVGTFDELPDGTLFGSAKVDNEDTWQRIKNGEIKGVSIDGIFKTIPVKQELSPEQLETVMELVKKINNK
jgi:hypothetical protein